MPSRADDRYFGKRGGSSKAFQSMISHYGLKEGVRVYHAVRNRNKRRQRGKRS